MEYVYWSETTDETSERQLTFDVDEFNIPENASSLWINYFWEVHKGIYPSITYLNISMPFDQNINIGKYYPNVITLKLGRYQHKFQHGFFPDKMKKLTLDTFYDEKIEIGVLPESLNCFYMSEWYNQKLDIGVLPLNLKEIRFGFWYNHGIEEGVLPPNITHLTLSSRYNKKIDRGVLPKSLKHIYFVNEYDPDVYNDYEIPDYATDVCKDREIQVDILPDDIVLDEITFGYGFDKPLIKDGIQKLKNVKKINFVKNKHGMKIFNIDQIDHRAFIYNQQIFLNENDITQYIHKKICVSDVLPMPIADEIIYNIG